MQSDNAPWLADVEPFDSKTSDDWSVRVISYSIAPPFQPPVVSNTKCAGSPGSVTFSYSAIPGTSGLFMLIGDNMDYHTTKACSVLPSSSQPGVYLTGPLITGFAPSEKCASKKSQPLAEYYAPTAGSLMPTCTGRRAQDAPVISPEERGGFLCSASGASKVFRYRLIYF